MHDVEPGWVPVSSRNGRVQARWVLVGVDGSVAERAPHLLESPRLRIEDDHAPVPVPVRDDDLIGRGMDGLIPGLTQFRLSPLPAYSFRSIWIRNSPSSAELEELVVGHRIEPDRFRSI